jgi:dynein assembly factor with WDR repeat domains 1
VTGSFDKKAKIWDA